MLCSHLGRPKGKVDPQYSLAPVARRLSELLDTDVELSNQVAGFGSMELAANLSPCDVMMLENLRFDPGEEDCTPSFATNLSELGDVYVDDAFGAAHRAHASIVGPPNVMPSAAGRLLAAEVARAEPAHGRARSAVRERARRGQGQRQARRDRRAARAVRHVADRRRDGVHLPARAGVRGRRLARRGGPRRALQAAARHRPHPRAHRRRRRAGDDRGRRGAARVRDFDAGRLEGARHRPRDGRHLRRRPGPGAHRVVERSDGRVRAGPVRGGHAQRRRGGRGVPRATPSSAAATARPRSGRWVSPATSTTCRRAVARRWN